MSESQCLHRSLALDPHRAGDTAVVSCPAWMLCSLQEQYWLFAAVPSPQVPHMNFYPINTQKQYTDFGTPMLS